MSTTLLIELKQEADRLYVAGSDLAAGDFRLKRLLPRFEALAAQAPVFGRLAELIRQLVDGAAADGSSTTAGVEAAVAGTDRGANKGAPGAGAAGEASDGAGPAWRLQELGLLLGSILATQSQAQPTEAASASPTGGLDLSTALTCRQLAKVEQALTETGGGRYEIVTDAYDRGYFKDLRLLPLAIKALGDPYPELADYILEHIIPLYGQAAVPYLIEDFDPQGGKKDARRLQAIARLGGDRGLILSSAEEGSDEVRSAAISCMSGLSEDIDLVIGYTRDRKKVIREVAYHALAKSQNPKAEETLYAAFAGKDQNLAASALSNSPWPELNRRLAPLLKPEVDFLGSCTRDPKDKAQAEALSRAHNLLYALGKARDPVLDAIFADVVRNGSHFQAFQKILDHAMDYLSRSGSREDLELLFELEEHHGNALHHAFRAAVTLLTPEELFEHYAGTWASKLKAAVTRKRVLKSNLIIKSLEMYLLNAERYTIQVPLRDGNLHEYTRMGMMSPEKIAKAWDPRWLDWAITQDTCDLVCVLARPDHKGCKEYLIRRLTEKQDPNLQHTANLLEGLERAGEAQETIHELLLGVLENKSNHSLYWLDYRIMNQLLRLPASYEERLRKLLDCYRYESKSQIEYVLKEMAK